MIMAIVYTWSFGALGVRNESGLTGVVKVIPYTLTGVAAGGLSASVSGNVMLWAPDPAHFVALGAITKQNAIDWCSAMLNVAALEAGLASQLAVPTVVFPDVTFVPPPAA
jgi:hypothetical protein